jgi:hypothetical protein
VSVKSWPCLACDALGVDPNMWTAGAGAGIRAARAGGGDHGGGGGGWEGPEPPPTGFSYPAALSTGSALATLGRGRDRLRFGRLQ